jgi:hypothetical protein
MNGLLHNVQADPEDSHAAALRSPRESGFGQDRYRIGATLGPLDRRQDSPMALARLQRSLAIGSGPISKSESAPMSTSAPIPVEAVVQARSPEIAPACQDRHCR